MIRKPSDSLAITPQESSPKSDAPTIGRSAMLSLGFLISFSASVCLGQQGKPATRPAGGSGGNLPTLDEVFAQLDKDHDGKITKDEATGAYAQRFGQWDPKGKGFATRADVHDYRMSLGINDDGTRAGNAGRRAGGPQTQPAGNRPPAGQGRAARPTTATILKEPEDWRLETFIVPPPFAPDVKMTGTEEARFSKGMYDTASDHYFTYLVAMTGDGELKWGAPDLKDFLEKYFRGLSASRGKRSGTTPDVKQMEATVTPVERADAGSRFTATMAFLDSFTDGRKVNLHIEAQFIPAPKTKKTIILFLISPSPTDSATWRELRELGNKAAANVP